MQIASRAVRVAVESSSATSVGFDASLSAMEIEFAGGAVHAALMDASSKGVFFNLHVRAKDPFARVAQTSAAAVMSVDPRILPPSGSARRARSPSSETGGSDRSPGRAKK